MLESLWHKGVPLAHLTRIALRTFAMIGGAVSASGQSAADEQAIRDVVTRFEIAWNTHDMKVLGSITTEDVDFVNVAGLHWKGRDQVVKEHAERHKVRFKNSVLMSKAVSVQFPRPDVALVHIDWETNGDLDFDLKPWPSRKGVFSWLMLKSEGRWRIRAAQNTDSTVPLTLGTTKIQK